VPLLEISNVYRKIAHAAMRAGRHPGDIKLIAVTKGVSPGRIMEAVNAGQRIFGESRVQEADKKISNLKSQISDTEIEWHMIGHLQRNKAKEAVRLFDLIHSIDSLRLMEALNKEAGRAGKAQRVLVEVKLSTEEAKHGIEKDELMALIKAGEGMENIKIDGLMTIPPYSDKPEDARPYYGELRELRDSLDKDGYSLPELSMGMTADFEVAIEEGSTMVRVGTAIFGEREKE
jgi:pyridoxal phosphate enzyme (YggS family)